MFPLKLTVLSRDYIYSVSTDNTSYTCVWVALGSDRNLN